MPQELSLHPSWDRMYLSGMTVQEIADFTGRARSTVHRHLQVREKYDGGLRAAHMAAREARGPGWPSVRWQRAYKAVHDFRATHDRLPNDGALAVWLGTQRSLHNRGLLPAVKVTLMSMIPGWDTPPHTILLDDRWRARCAELEAFVAKHGHWPHYKRHTTEHEHTLGVWLHTQHQARAEGRLTPWRQVELDAAAPGWRSQM